MTAVASPALAPSVETVNAAVPWCSFRLGLPLPSRMVRPDDRAALAGEVWVSCGEVLAVPSFFTRWQAALSTRMADTYSSVPQVTPAGYVMSWYAGMFGYLGGMLFHQARRVPALAPETLAFTVGPEFHRPVAVALRSPAFTCLPSDPGAGSPHATVVPDEDALAAVLRAEVAAHGARFVAAYRQASRFGPHTLWGAVTDALDRGLWHLAHRGGDDPAGAASAALVLPRRLAPFTSGSTIRRVRGPSGAEHWTRTRQSCCFYYKLPEAEGPCVTCPRLTEALRAQLLDEQS
ncbi:MAG TPA: (2Fe-2S)-binding protein [Pseudonocardiaceae bacterium]